MESPSSRRHRHIPELKVEPKDDRLTSNLIRVQSLTSAPVGL
jgi:hypothetical protein